MKSSFQWPFKNWAFAKDTLLGLIVGEFECAGGVELYTSVLYSLLHMIGADADRNGQFEMIEHLRKAFHIEPKQHLEIYNQV